MAPEKSELLRPSVVMRPSGVAPMNPVTTGTARSSNSGRRILRPRCLLCWRCGCAWRKVSQVSTNSDEVTGTAARPSCCSAAAKSRALNRSPKDAKRSEDSPLAAPSFQLRTSCSRSWRSEEHTSELQSLRHLVCRLLLEKKKQKEKRDGNYWYSPSESIHWP